MEINIEDEELTLNEQIAAQESKIASWRSKVNFWLFLSFWCIAWVVIDILVFSKDGDSLVVSIASCAICLCVAANRSLRHREAVGKLTELHTT